MFDGSGLNPLSSEGNIACYNLFKFFILYKVLLRIFQGSVSNGLYCELMYQWVHQMDDKSRKMMLLDAAYLSQPSGKIDFIFSRTAIVLFFFYLIKANFHASELSERTEFYSVKRLSSVTLYSNLKGHFLS